MGAIRAIPAKRCSVSYPVVVSPPRRVRISPVMSASEAKKT
jgi:hypothetical protein